MNSRKRPLPIRIGGLMRCCIQAIRSADVEPKEGAAVVCPGCKSTAVVRSGAWEWAKG
jgi:hypothetical protein